MNSINHVSDEILVAEYRRRFELPKGVQILNSNTAVNHLRGMFGDDINRAEKFVVMYLDSQNKLIETEVLFTGTINKSSVFPRTIAEHVLKYKAACLIIAHNHPSGNLEFSNDDYEITKKIMAVLSLFDVSILDHILITVSEHNSMVENRTLPEIRKLHSFPS